MDAIDRLIIDTLQGGIPTSEEPFAEAAQRIGISEEDLLACLDRLKSANILTRIGPMFQIERMGGAFTLAALHAPEERFEDIAREVNAMPEVAHNYARTNHLNMWFVIATETPERIEDVIREIEARTGCEVFNFPKTREFFVEMKLQVNV